MVCSAQLACKPPVPICSTCIAKDQTPLSLKECQSTFPKRQSTSRDSGKAGKRRWSRHTTGNSAVSITPRASTKATTRQHIIQDSVLNNNYTQIHAPGVPTCMPGSTVALASEHALKHWIFVSCNWLSASIGDALMPQEHLYKFAYKWLVQLHNPDTCTCITVSSRILWTTEITGIVKWVVW